MEELLIGQINKLTASVIVMQMQINKLTSSVLVMQINKLTASVLDDKQELLLKIRIKLNDQACKR